MELETLRWLRRAASVALALSALALVMAKTRGPSESGGDAVGPIAAVGFCVSLVLFVLAWRKEHAANEAAFAARERQTLAALKLEAELARRRAVQQRAEPPPGGDGAPGAQGPGPLH